MKLKQHVKEGVCRALTCFRLLLWKGKQSRAQSIRLRMTSRHSSLFLPWGDIGRMLYINDPMARWDRGFESRELGFYEKTLSRGMTVVDAGANIGLYSLLGARLVGESGTIYAFEPAEATFSILQKNIGLNMLKNIHAYKLALSDREGYAAIKVPDYTPKGFADAYKFIDYSATNAAGGASEQVELMSLDEFTRREGIGKVDFIKIDVEGTQLNVLKGAKRVLEENRGCTILFECPEAVAFIPHYRQHDSFAFLSALGFEISTWDLADGKLKNIREASGSPGNFVAARPA